MKKRIVIKRRVTCKSGLRGGQDRLQNIYGSFAEYELYAEYYGLHTKVGFKTIEAAWKANPIIRYSTNPADYEKRTLKNYNTPSVSRNTRINHEQNKRHDRKKIRSPNRRQQDAATGEK